MRVAACGMHRGGLHARHVSHGHVTFRMLLVWLLCISRSSPSQLENRGPQSTS